MSEVVVVIKGKVRGRDSYEEQGQRSG